LSGPIDDMREAGFSNDEVAQWATQKRQELSGAGFGDDEIDKYMGGPTPPKEVPQAMQDRFEAGSIARKREGGLVQTIPQTIDLLSTPDGRTKLWNAVKQYPSEFLKGMLEQVKLPGDVYEGKVDLNTPEGLDKAIGLGTLIGSGRPNKLPLTGKTSGMALVSGEQMSRIDRGPMGDIVETPIGGLPKTDDFVNAGRDLTGKDSSPPVEQKLIAKYEKEGVHPAEVAHDAQSDPVAKQDILSRDTGEFGNGGGGEEPPGNGPMKDVTPPEPGSLEEAQKKILDKISVGEDEKSRAWSWSRAYTNLVDKLYPISKAVAEIDKELPTPENPYQLARLLSGYAGKADHMLNEGTFDFNTYKNNGPSLKSILAPVTNEMDGFRAFAASARAVELEKRDVQTGFDLDAAKVIGKQGFDKYGKTLENLVGYQNRVAAYLRDSGVLSKKGFDAMTDANRLYVPFNRVMDAEAHGMSGAGMGLQASNPISRIKGSAREVIDPIENVIRNTYTFTAMAEKNVIGTKLIDMLKRAEGEMPDAPKAAEKLPVPIDRELNTALTKYLEDSGVKRPESLVDALSSAAKPAKEGEISIFRDGKRETYKVDTDLAAAMKGLDSQSVGLLEKLLAFPARTLRAGAVLTPDFQLRHTIRDFMYATVTTTKGVFTPMDMAKGFMGLITKDPDYWNWMKGGGGKVSMVSMDRRYLQEDLRRLTNQTGLMVRAWNVVADPSASIFQKTKGVAALPFDAVSKFLIHPLQVATEFAENASHLASFKKSMRQVERAGGDVSKESIQNSAFYSRDVAVDAARMGANMRAYNMITAFSNIVIQDTDRVARAFINNPIGTTVKIGGAITLPSLLLWYANHEDPRYKEITEWEKDMFWVVMTENHIFRLPKPWGMGIIFGSLPERMMQSYYDKNPDAFKNFFKSIKEVSIPSFIPTAAAPVVDQFANRSTFTNRTLIPADVEKQLPEYQYTPYTTELSKALGKIVGSFPGMRDASISQEGMVGGAARAVTSPILIENYIRAWSGGLGNYALQAADALLRKAGVLPDPPKPTSTLSDIPVIKSFVVRYPTATTQSLQDFQDQYESNKRYYDTWMAKAKEGDVEATQRIEGFGGPRIFVQLDGIKQTLTEHSHLIRDIYKDPKMPPDEKRQLIDTLYYSMIEIGKSGKEMMREIFKDKPQTVH